MKRMVRVITYPEYYPGPGPSEETCLAIAESLGAEITGDDDWGVLIAENDAPALVQALEEAGAEWAQIDEYWPYDDR